MPHHYGKKTIVRIACGLIIYPIVYQLGTEEIILAFFEKWRAKVQATFYLKIDESICTLLYRIPTYNIIQHTSNDNPAQNLLFTDVIWEEKQVPYVFQALP